MLVLCFFTPESHRILIVGSDSHRDSTREFANVLSKLNCSVTRRRCGDDIIAFNRFNEYLYDTVVIGAGAGKCLGRGQEIFPFLDDGGGAIILNGIGEKETKNQEMILKHLSVKGFPNQAIHDISSSPTGQRLALERIVAPPTISKWKGTLQYEGGYGIIDHPDDFRLPLVQANLRHTTQRAAGFEILPIYALQGRSGGRVVLIHSSTFITDDLWADNGQFISDLVEWVVHWKNSYRVINISLDPEMRQYRVGENITIEARAEAVQDGRWLPLAEPVLQVELFMLGVFTRHHMKVVEPGLFRETLRLPDRCGNFKIKVFTDLGLGVYNARYETVISVGPLPLRERPRFRFAILPYSFGSILALVGAWFVAAHFMID